MLNVEGLKSGYQRVQILHGVTLNIDEGEIVSVIGRNGVGKSTFMKTVIGIIPAAEGKIFFQNEDISRQKAHLRAKLGIGYVPQ